MPGSKTVSANWRRAGADLFFTVTGETLAKYPVADFFPLPEGDVVVGHPKVESRDGTEVTFRIPIETGNSSSINGLVVFGQRENDNDRAAWRLVGTPAASGTSPAPAGGVLTFLFFGFLGGIILNLMPCVLPVISLKIFGFIQHAGQSRGNILRSGIAFAGGIFAWFVGLALILIGLKIAGHDITWGGFQFTNPYFVSC